MNEILSRIAVDPRICFGKPCVRGTRIWVSLLLDFLASGATIEEILENYSQLKREDVLAAIAYGAEMSRERYVDLLDAEPITGRLWIEAGRIRVHENTFPE